MAIKKCDYRSEFLQEGENLYSNLFSINEYKFNDWVTKNFNELGTIGSFEVVRPSREIFDEIINSYRHIHGQCHYSAKAVCLLNCEIEYYTGFIMRDYRHFPLVTHSFNMYKGSIIDFSRFKNDFTVIEEGASSLPHTYYGIKIPTEFVVRFREDVFEKKSMNPLLSEWYWEQKASLK